MTTIEAFDLDADILLTAVALEPIEDVLDYIEERTISVTFSVTSLTSRSF